MPTPKTASDAPSIDLPKPHAVAVAEPPAPVATDKTSAEPSAETGETPSPIALPTDAKPSESNVKVEPPVLAFPPGLPALPLPGALATAESPKPADDTPAPSDNIFASSKKSWETTLEPVVVPLKNNFIYKRAVLPEVIYRDSYGKENRHLPRRITREDYAHLLFVSISKNDVEATRALLNAGTGLNVTTPEGETPLALAERVGAVEVAALLAARQGR